MPEKVLKTIKPRKYQQEIYENCKNKNCLVVLPTGIGKCMEYSEPLLFSDGSTKKIGEYFDEEAKQGKVLKGNKNQVSIKPKVIKKAISLNDSFKLEEQEIIAIHKIKADLPLLRIKTYAGAEISVTPEHPLLTLNKNLEWIRADQLKINNPIATPLKLPEPKNNRKINIIYVFNKINSNMNCYVKIKKDLAKKINLNKECKLRELLNKGINEEELAKNILYFKIRGGRADSTPIKKIEKFSQELLYWIALVMGEGGMYGGIKFYNEDKTLLNLFKKLSYKIFGVESKKIKGGLKVSSTALHFFVRNLFDLKSGQHSREKKISNYIMKLDNKCISSFLSGLYDAEGSIRKDGLIELTTASKELADRLCYLLLRFGIKPRIHEKISSATNSSKPIRRTYYRINIEGTKDAKIFDKYINFKQKDKKRKLKKFLRKNLKYNPNFNLIPISGEVIRKIRNSLGLSSTKWKDFEIPGIDTYERGERNFSKETLKKAIAGFKKSEVINKEITNKIKFLEKLLNSEIYWDKIKKIEKVKEDWVYDISLDKNFNFIAGHNGGVIAHNTLVALMLCINRQKAFPGSKFLFLAPTRPLADQQHSYFKKQNKELFAQLNLFTGKVDPEKRKKIWEKADIIFSTPQCIGNDLKNNLYDLADTSLLIEDECVTSNTKIRLIDGSLKRIEEIYKEFKLDSKIYVESLSESGNKEPQRILKVYKIKNKRKILKIKTKNRVIKLTENHKLILKRGLKYLWTEAKNIKKEDEVAIEQNIENSKYKEKIIMSEEKMIKNYFLTHQNLDKYFLKIIHRLNERDILPLSYSSLKLKIISRLFGFILGDGWFTKIKGEPKILGFSGKIEDLEKIQMDLDILGVRYPKINSRKTNSLIRTDQNKIICVNGTTNSFNVTDSALARLFEVLKMPQGSKTTNPFLIPKWLIKSPKFIKREFLSALMGCEGDIPKFKKDLRSPYATRYRFNKLRSLKENALEYASQIQTLFNEFGVKSAIQIRSGNIRKDKQKTIQIQITLSNSNLNLHRFLERIGYEYNYKKIKEANKILNYLSYKEEELRKRDFFYRKIIQLKNRGFKIHKAIQIISKKFKIKPTRIWGLGYSNKANHASWLIDSYDKWSKSNKPNLNVKWEKIKDIKIEGNKKYVYDLTVEKNHNYIGNGFIVHNCHRCLKNYSYTYVATKYKEQAKNPRILGLTASPGTDKQTITKIANNLGIESIELRTRESEDVKEYLQKLEFNIIKLEFPDEFKEIVNIIKKLYEKKVNELKNRKLIFRPANKITLLEAQGNIMRSISSGNRNPNFLAGASACAQAIKLSHLIELIQTQTLHTSLEYIKSIFQQSAQNKSKAAKQIAKNPEFNQAYIKINELLARNLEHPKLLELKSIVEESIKNNPKTKIIVFSQYRETGTRICKELNSIQTINAKVFVGQAKKTSDKGIVSGLNQKEQHEIIEEFKQRKINCLVSTSIGEEGLDLPEINTVIFYEPIPSAIRTIQRRGRTARLMKGKLTILVTKDTLDEIFYYAAIAKEKRMYKAISSIKGDLDNGKPLNPEKETEQKRLF